MSHWFFSEHDVLVLPSYWEVEGHPGIIIESLQCGVPVISTKWSGIPEVVQHEKSGLLVTPKSVSAVKSAIHRMIGDPELYRELCNGAHARGEFFRSRVWYDRMAEDLRRPLQKEASGIIGCDVKIAYLHQYFHTPSQAGSTRSYEFARRWVRGGDEVHIVTSVRTRSRSHRGWRIREVDGISIHEIAVPYDNHMGAAARVRAFFEFAVRAGPRATAIQPDVLFATSTPLTIAIPAAYAKLRTRAALVFEVRGSVAGYTHCDGSH